MGRSWGGLGAVLRRLGASWGVLGRPGASWRVLGQSWVGLGAVFGGLGEPRAEGTHPGEGKKVDPWGLLETNNLTAGICKTRNWRLKAYRLGRNCKELCLEATLHSLVAPKGPAD